MGAGSSQDVTYPLSASPPEGDYTLTITGATAQPGAEPLHVDLLLRTDALASGDVMLLTTVSMQPATATLTLHARAITASCGDPLIVRVKNAGTQTVFPFQLALDVP